KKVRRPKILVIGMAGNFLGVVKLPAALQKAGAEVGVLSVEGSFLSATGLRDWSIVLPKQGAFLWRKRYTVLLLAALFRGRHGLVVPTDEGTLRRLHHLRY